MKYLSPTAVIKSMRDEEDFYLTYVAEKRPPRPAQTEPMAIGSAFDAYVKAFIHKRLFDNADPKYQLDTLIEEQVEPQNRDWAKENGEYVFESYRKSGALSDLLHELKFAITDPCLEFSVEGKLEHSTFVDGVPLLGKPDLYFSVASGQMVIYDWKVNGYCSNSAQSPKPGFIKCRDGWDSSVAKPSRNNNDPHKDAVLGKVDDLTINLAMPMNKVYDDWAIQLCMYSWILGAPIGSEFIVGIDQLVCKPAKPKPLIRVASHRSIIEPNFQVWLHDYIVQLWDKCHRGFTFEGMTDEESAAKRQLLDQYDTILEENPWLQGAVRKHKNF